MKRNLNKPYYWINKRKEINITCHYFQFTLSDHNLKFSLHTVIKYLLSHLHIIKFSPNTGVNLQRRQQSLQLICRAVEEGCWLPVSSYQLADGLNFCGTNLTLCQYFGLGESWPTIFCKDTILLIKKNPVGFIEKKTYVPWYLQVFHNFNQVTLQTNNILGGLTNMALLNIKWKVFYWFPLKFSLTNSWYIFLNSILLPFSSSNEFYWLFKLV